MLVLYDRLAVFPYKPCIVSFRHRWITIISQVAASPSFAAHYRCTGWFDDLNTGSKLFLQNSVSALRVKGHRCILFIPEYDVDSWLKRFRLQLFTCTRNHNPIHHFNVLKVDTVSYNLPSPQCTVATVRTTYFIIKYCSTHVVVQNDNLFGKWHTQRGNVALHVSLDTTPL